jgi:hypothetical protein
LANVPYATTPGRLLPMTAAGLGTAQGRTRRRARQRLAAIAVGAPATLARRRARQRLAAIAIGTPTTLTRRRAGQRLAAVRPRTAHHPAATARPGRLLAGAVAFGRDCVTGDDQQNDGQAEFPCRHHRSPPLPLCLCLCSRQARPRRNGKTAIPRRFVRWPPVAASRTAFPIRPVFADGLRSPSYGNGVTYSIAGHNPLVGKPLAAIHYPANWLWVGQHFQVPNRTRIRYIQGKGSEVRGQGMRNETEPGWGGSCTAARRSRPLGWQCNRHPNPVPPSPQRGSHNSRC